MEAVFIFDEFTTGQYSCPLWFKDKLKDAGLSELDCHSRFAPRNDCRALDVFLSNAC